MKIKTLGDYMKHQPKQDAQKPLEARVRLYQAMSEYMSTALVFVAQEDAQSRESYASATRSLLTCLMQDAKAHISKDKYEYLLRYEIEPEEPPTAYAGSLFSAMVYMWGVEDVFIQRLSGGLPGSYIKAIAALKGQSRHVGFTLSQIINKQGA